jgi:hypothetical protein
MAKATKTSSNESRLVGAGKKKTAMPKATKTSSNASRLVGAGKKKTAMPKGRPVQGAGGLTKKGGTYYDWSNPAAGTGGEKKVAKKRATKKKMRKTNGY